MWLHSLADCRSHHHLSCDATADHIALCALMCKDQIKLNINGPPVLNTPIQLGAGPLSKARCSIVGLEDPGTPSGTVVEDTDTQEAPDDIRECLHGLMHTRLSMCMLGLPWGRVIRCPGITDPCCARKHNPKRSHAITSVGLFPVQFQRYVTFLHCFLPVYSCRRGSILRK